jgi:hypothetical protein
VSRQAGRVLRHGGCHQEWRDERYCDDVFHKFSAAFFDGARCTPSFQPRLRSLDVFGCISLSFANDQILSIITILNDDFDIDQRTLVVDV